MPTQKKTTREASMGGDACLIPVDEPARQVTAMPEEEIKSPTKAAKKST